MRYAQEQILISNIRHQVSGTKLLVTLYLRDYEKSEKKILKFIRFCRRWHEKHTIFTNDIFFHIGAGYWVHSRQEIVQCSSYWFSWFECVFHWQFSCRNSIKQFLYVESIFFVNHSLFNVFTSIRIIIFILVFAWSPFAGRRASKIWNYKKNYLLSSKMDRINRLGVWSASPFFLLIQWSEWTNFDSHHFFYSIDAFPIESHLKNLFPLFIISKQPMGWNNL